MYEYCFVSSGLTAICLMTRTSLGVNTTFFFLATLDFFILRKLEIAMVKVGAGVGI